MTDHRRELRAIAYLVALAAAAFIFSLVAKGYLP